ncbi:GLPGLI family protein [Flavobacterium sp.]|uniref:GLPGLI family protein n=1 Tax=Flavobacterium sp. TaxID=239 RepID=UPI00286A6F73|nr:GLPGLI family protein [Flavobacterium sp.]
MNKIFFLFLLLNFNCFSQNVEVKYFENEINSSTNQFKELPKNLLKAYKPNFYSYKLLTDGKLSQYQNEKIDQKNEEEASETTMVTESGDTIKTIVTSTGFDTRVKEKLFIKDYKKNKIYDEFFFNEKIKIVDNFIEWNWKILDDAETVLGYKCRKATSNKFGSDIYVWFTDDIPISDGPGKYCGLPGLILKVKLRSYEIIAYDIKFKKEKLEIQQPVFNGKIYTYNEFIEEINRRNK